MCVYMHVVVQCMYRQVGGFVVMIHTPVAPETSVPEFVKQYQLRKFVMLLVAYYRNDSSDQWETRDDEWINQLEYSIGWNSCST